MTENSCRTCALAQWKRTASGRLHPSGEGRCTWVYRQPVIPGCMYWIGFNSSAPKPNGGYINRRLPAVLCPTWEAAP